MFARAKGKQQKYVRQLQSVRNSVLIISPIFFSNCRVQFCDNCAATPEGLGGWVRLLTRNLIPYKPKRQLAWERSC